MSKRSGVSLAILLALAAAPAVATAAPSPYAAPRSAIHDVARGEHAYKLFVMTPPGYGAPENAGRRYPVIYLNDGELMFMAAAGAPLLSWYNRQLEEVIIVGVSYASGENPIASRQRDLTPVEDASISGESGGAADYLALFREKIIPAIESDYRADPARRTLAGHSFGATFAAYSMFTAPDLFESYILVSPALWYGDRAIAKREDRFFAEHKSLPARVYMAVGDLEGPKGGLKNLDMVNDERAFAARLRSRNYSGFELRDEVLGEGVNHSTSFAAAWLRALEWLYPPK